MNLSGHFSTQICQMNKNVDTIE